MIAVKNNSLPNACGEPLKVKLWASKGTSSAMTTPACRQRAPKNITVSTMISPFVKPLGHRRPKTTEHKAHFF